MKKFIIGVIALMCLSSTSSILGQNWKAIQNVFEGKKIKFSQKLDLDTKLDSARSDTLIRYISLSKMDSCEVVDSLNYTCWFTGNFSVDYTYRQRSHDAYVIIRKDKQEYQIWIWKMYGLRLKEILKQKDSVLINHGKKVIQIIKGCPVEVFLNLFFISKKNPRLRAI